MNLDPDDIPHLLVVVLREVHQHLGSGLHIDGYKACLAHELRMHELFFDQDAAGYVEYKSLRIPLEFTMDFIVEDSVIINCYAVDSLEASHKNLLKQQLHTTGIETGLLVNFHARDLRMGGIKRIIVTYKEPLDGWKSADDDAEFEAEERRKK